MDFEQKILTGTRAELEAAADYPDKWVPVWVTDEETLHIGQGADTPPTPIGAVGLRGPVGNTGATGATGGAGADGFTGERGLPGGVGPAGEDGDVGRGGAILGGVSGASAGMKNQRDIVNNCMRGRGYTPLN